MVQIVENHAVISCEILSIAPDPEHAGFDRIMVKVLTTAAVGAAPDLFERDKGQVIGVLARSSSQAVRPDSGTVSLRVRKAGPNLSFVEE